MVNLNAWAAKQQRHTLAWILIGILIALFAFWLLMPKKEKSVKTTESQLNLTGVVDESFSEADSESALNLQQVELDTLKSQIKILKDSIVERDAQQKEMITQLIQENIPKITPNPEVQIAYNESASSHDINTFSVYKKPTALHSVSFNYAKKKAKQSSLNSSNYVPSGTFVRAVILGGADADASVNGQSKNNGVMLFKLLQPGTLPNGQHSRLQGCFVTGSSYGDISSERAYVILDKLSCAHPGEPILDKSVTGWAFFGGKVGVKGVPLMRDNKVMQWAGLSGVLSGIASAAQYSQSVQSISALGAATSVPSTNIAPYAAYGGASKAAEVLSNYYVKRAEQYHPVIQVGAGNFVTIVFKDGFYLKPDEPIHKNYSVTESTNEPDFTVPNEVLSKINPSYQAMNEDAS